MPLANAMRLAAPDPAVGPADDETLLAPGIH